MFGESNQNVFLNKIDASSFAEFEISEFEISRVDFNCEFFFTRVMFNKLQQPVGPLLPTSVPE